MKHKVVGISVATALTFGIVSSVGALELPTTSSSSTLFGQTHNYYVRLRADNTAIVSAKLLFSATSEVKKTVEFTVPNGVDSANVEAVQIIPPKYCEGYDSNTTYNQTPAKKLPVDCSKYKIDYDALVNNYVTYRGSGYGGESLKYQLAPIQHTDKKVAITLPQQVEAQGMGALLVQYRTKSFAQTNLGFGSFHFSSFVVPEAVNKLTVAVMLDDELYVREQTAKGSYKDSSVSIKNGITNSAVENKQLDRMVQIITSGGGMITKSADGLAPNEVYQVKFDYADAQWKLFLGWIISGSIALIAIVVVMVILYRKIYKGEK